MIRNLTHHGDDLAIVLDRTMLDRLGIDAATPLEVTTDGTNVILAPVRDEARRAAFEEALERANRRFAPALKKLAE